MKVDVWYHKMKGRYLYHFDGLSGENIGGIVAVLLPRNWHVWPRPKTGPRPRPMVLNESGCQVAQDERQPVPLSLWLPLWWKHLWHSCRTPPTRLTCLPGNHNPIHPAINVLLKLPKKLGSSEYGWQTGSISVAFLLWGHMANATGNTNIDTNTNTGSTGKTIANIDTNTNSKCKCKQFTLATSPEKQTYRWALDIFILQKRHYKQEQKDINMFNISHKIYIFLVVIHIM